jgi:hypothetical protein
MAASSTEKDRTSRGFATSRKAIASVSRAPSLIAIYLNDHLAGATGGT